MRSTGFDEIGHDVVSLGDYLLHHLSVLEFPVLYYVGSNGPRQPLGGRVEAQGLTRLFRGANM